MVVTMSDQYYYDFHSNDDDVQKLLFKWLTKKGFHEHAALVQEGDWAYISNMEDVIREFSLAFPKVKLEMCSEIDNNEYFSIFYNGKENYINRRIEIAEARQRVLKEMGFEDENQD